MASTKDSTVYCHMLNGQEQGVWSALNTGAYCAALAATIEAICNTIQNVHEGCNKVYWVSFGLKEGATLIGDSSEEQQLMQVLWSSSVFMKRLWPRHLHAMAMRVSSNQ